MIGCVSITKNPINNSKKALISNKIIYIRPHQVTHNQVKLSTMIACDCPPGHY